MEKIFKSRNTIRKSFTKTVNNINALLKNESKELCEIKSLVELLEKRYNELSKLDGKLHDLMLDSNFPENDLDNETHSVDEFTVTFNRVRAAVLNLLDENSLSWNKSVSFNTNNDYVKCQLQLLLPELKLFGGDLLEWVPFWLKFKTIDEDSTINPENKFQYLIQAIEPSSEASDFLKNITKTGDNYFIAISELKARFGREDVLIELYVKELLNLVSQNVQKSKILKFSVLYDKLEYNLRALNTLIMTKKCSSILLPLVESCLPEEILKVWQINNDTVTYKSKNTSKYRLQKLMRFLKAESEAQKLGEVSSNNDLKEISISKTNGSNEATKLLTSTNDCTICGEKHKTTKCTETKKIALQEVNCLNTKVNTNKSFKGENEADIIYLRSLDPKKWKDQDHYRVLGLPKLRYKATDEQIKNAYSTKVFNHIPDKRRKLGEKVQVDDDYFICILKAWEILGNKKKRREYDSNDSKFDNSIPSEEMIKKSEFFKLFGPAFVRNSKWSEEVMPLLGDINSSRDHVDKFYKSWYNFNSWREFSYLNKEHCEQDSNQDECRLIDKQEANLKKEEKIRIKKLVDLAYANDPRILKLKENGKVVPKQTKKDTKQKPEKVKVQKEKEEVQLKIEKDHQETKSATKQTKQKPEKVKVLYEKEETKEKAKQIALKTKENQKKELQKERTHIRDLCKTNNYYLKSGDNVFEVMSGVEKLCDQLSVKQLKQLANALEKEGHKALVNKLKQMEF